MSDEPLTESQDKFGKDKPLKRRLVWLILSSVLLLVVFSSQVDDRYHAFEWTLHRGDYRVGLLREHGMIGVGGYQTQFHSKQLKLYCKHGDYFDVAYLLDGHHWKESAKSRVILPGIRYHHYQHQNTMLWFITVWHPLLTLLATLCWGWTFYRYHQARHPTQKEDEKHTFRIAAFDRAVHWLSRPGKRLKTKFWVCAILAVLAFANLFHNFERTLLGLYDMQGKRLIAARVSGRLSFGYVEHPRIQAGGIKWINERATTGHSERYSGVTNTVLGLGWKYNRQPTWYSIVFCMSLHYTTLGLLALTLYYKLRMKYVFHHRAKYLCLQCGYDLRATEVCAHAISKEEKKDRGKRCPECGEFNPLAVQITDASEMDTSPKPLQTQPYPWHRRILWFMVTGIVVLIALHIDSHWQTIEAGFQISDTQYTFNNENGMMIFSILNAQEHGLWQSDMPIYFAIKSRKIDRGWNFKYDWGWDRSGFDYLDLWDTYSVFENAIFIAWHISVTIVWSLMTLICWGMLRLRLHILAENQCWDELKGEKESLEKR